MKNKLKRWADTILEYPPLPQGYTKEQKQEFIRWMIVFWFYGLLGGVIGTRIYLFFF